MSTPKNTAGSNRGPAELLDVGAVAAMLGCGRRHVYRLADSGRMPRPVKLGVLVRWRRAEVLAWIEGGCKPPAATPKPPRTASGQIMLRGVPQW